MEREVARQLQRMNNFAPGPDGVTYRNLRIMDSQAQLFAVLFSPLSGGGSRRVEDLQHDFDL